MGEGKPTTEVLSLRWLEDRELQALKHGLDREVKSSEDIREFYFLPSRILDLMRACGGEFPHE